LTGEWVLVFLLLPSRMTLAPPFIINKHPQPCPVPSPIFNFPLNFRNVNPTSLGFWVFDRCFVFMLVVPRSFFTFFWSHVFFFLSFRFIPFPPWEAIPFVSSLRRNNSQLGLPIQLRSARVFGGRIPPSDRLPKFFSVFWLRFSSLFFFLWFGGLWTLNSFVPLFYSSHPTPPLYPFGFLLCVGFSPVLSDIIQFCLVPGHPSSV